MSFQYKIFPELKLKHGTVKTINDPVAITSNGNREIRRKINKTERYSWDIPARNLYQSDMQAIIEFAAMVGTDSFLYKDPTKPELVNQKCTYFDAGGTPHFALMHSGNHPVLNLSVAGLGHLETWELGNVLSPDIVVKRNGVVMDFWDGMSISNMNFDPSVHGSSLPRTSVFYAGLTTWISTDIITYSGPLYHTVRFDSQISYKIAAMAKSTLLSGGCDVVPTVSEMANIKLMEVFEYVDTQ